MEAQNETSATGGDAGSQPAKPSIASIDAGPVQAYAKLEGADQCYYLRTLQVTMGRSDTKADTVDIPLGNAKSISRRHARLFYNFTTQRFEFMVFGKNGAFINEQFIERGVTVPLENRAKIRIGDVSFKFLLPRTNVGPEEDEPEMESSSVVNMTLDSGEMTDSQDYATNKDAKPPYSYATLIAQAINSTEDKRMALHEIYNYITTRYPYFQMAQNGWQNSIRHNLSLNKAFVKVPRGDAEPGKGSFWMIDPKAGIPAMTTIAKRAKRPAPKSSSESSGPSKSIKKEDAGDKSETDTVAGTSAAPVASAAAAAAAVAVAEAATTETPHTDPPTVTLPTAAAATSPPPAPSVQATGNATTVTPVPVPTDTSVPLQPAAAAQANFQTQIQLQLQNTIRQHLLDPVRYPLPPSIAQLLPQAIAQLPPHLASQFSSTLQSAIRAHASASSSSTPPTSTSTPAPPTTTTTTTSNTSTPTPTTATPTTSPQNGTNAAAPAAPSSSPSS